jgi:hypothetical protein
MSDQTAPTPAQPEGQGGDPEATGTGLYDLASAPEEYRPFIEAELKKIEGNVTRKFQEHAAERKQWESLADLNLHDVPREDLEGLLQLNELAKDEEAFDNWLREVAQARGILDGEPVDDDDEDDDDLDIGSIIEQRLQEALAPLHEQLAGQQREQAVSQESQAIEQELDGLLTAQQLELGEEDRQTVYALAAPFADDDPDGAIQKGLEAFLRIRGGAQRELVQSKAQQPSGAMEGGTPASKPEEIRSFDAAKKAARQRFNGGSL